MVGSLINLVIFSLHKGEINWGWKQIMRGCVFPFDHNSSSYVKTSDQVCRQFQVVSISVVTKLTVLFLQTSSRRSSWHISLRAMPPSMQTSHSLFSLFEMFSNLERCFLFQPMTAKLTDLLFPRSISSQRMVETVLSCRSRNDFSFLKVGFSFLGLQPLSIIFMCLRKLLRDGYLCCALICLMTSVLVVLSISTHISSNTSILMQLSQLCILSVSANFIVFSSMRASLSSSPWPLIPETIICSISPNSGRFCSLESYLMSPMMEICSWKLLTLRLYSGMSLMMCLSSMFCRFFQFFISFAASFYDWNSLKSGCTRLWALEMCRFLYFQKMGSSQLRVMVLPSRRAMSFLAKSTWKRSETMVRQQQFLTRGLIRSIVRSTSRRCMVLQLLFCWVSYSSVRFD